MKIKYFVIPFFIMLFLSCPEEPDLPKGTFWVRDFTTNSDYKIKADLLYTGKYCTIWAENGALTEAQAWDVANEYDNNIYPIMVETFGTNLNYSGRVESTMEYADVDGDGKLCILFLDIKDGYNGKTINSYIAGYFYAQHLMSGSSSNKSDMIFIDTYPGLKQEQAWDNIFITIAHEMQHLMNFVNSIGLNRRHSGYYGMDTWIDEGLSSAAEYIYYKEKKGASFNLNFNNRINDFNTNLGGKGKIHEGNNFFVWGNRGSVLDDYSTVYLFFQWLRIHSIKIDSDGTSIYNDIMKSKHGDYNAVTDAAQKINPEYKNWNILLRDWLAANYINNSSSIYGYKGEITLTILGSNNGISTLVDLYPGEGVYSSGAAAKPPNTGNINYERLTKNDGISNNGDILLTYNVNSNNLNGIDKGTTTSTSLPSASINADNQGRSLLGGSNGPYRIGAQEFLRYPDSSDVTLLKFFTEDAADEN